MVQAKSAAEAITHEVEDRSFLRTRRNINDLECADAQNPRAYARERSSPLRAALGRLDLP